MTLTVNWQAIFDEIESNKLARYAAKDAARAAAKEARAAAERVAAPFTPGRREGAGETAEILK